MQDPQTHELYAFDHAEVRRIVEAADPEAGPWPIHGVAVADGDILHDKEGNPVLMTAEELAKADYSPAASKLTKDHPDYEGFSPPVDATVGNNSMQYSDDGEAVVYDATTHNEEIAAGVNGKTYGVSIHAGFRTGEPDPDTGIPVARDIVFHDLSVVSLGDSPSNTAQYGGRSDVAAWARSGGLEAALAESAVGGEEDDDVEGLVHRLAVRLGILNPDDSRGRVWFEDQTTDGETVTVMECGFRDAPWMVSLHRSGDEFPDIGEGLGPALGTGDPHEAGDNQSDETVELDDPLTEDETLFALLRYHADGEVSEPITSSDGAHFVESAFVGVAPDGVEIEAEQGEGRSGESGRDAASGKMTDRDDNIQFITANSHFNEKMLADMDDEEVEETRDLVDEEAEEDNTDEQTPDTLGDMTPDQLGDVLREQGFVTEDEVGEAVEASHTAATKEEQVDEIIAESAEYDDDDREELMSSHPNVVKRIHKDAITPGAAPLPGVGGARDTAEAAIGNTEEHGADEFTTGVSR